MSLDKSRHHFGVGGFPNPIRHVNRVKIRMRNVTVHRLQPDMVGVHVIRLLPAHGIHRRLHRRPGVGWLGAHDEVLAVGFVPDRSDVRALLRRQNEGLKLRPRLVGKTVPHPERKLFQFQQVCHK